MASPVINLSDDEGEHVVSQHWPAPRLLSSKQEWDPVPSIFPEGFVQGYTNGSVSGNSNNSGFGASAMVQIKGKMREDTRLVEHTPSDTVCRQFWQAGNYEAHPPKRSKATQGAMDHLRVHPKFLHSNATSHKWALGAIAELLDNSIDEIVNGATYVRVDKIDNPRDGTACLLVQARRCHGLYTTLSNDGYPWVDEQNADDGGGMSPDDIRQCMSLGYSQKNSNTTIGQYGNGFKTSTMRLGADVIVLSRKENQSGFVTQSVGLLSYTFLRETGHEDIVVPMIDYKVPGVGVKPVASFRSNRDDWLSNLATITRWSPYRSEEEIIRQFDDIGKHGTKVVIYNLWHNDDGHLELDFDTNQHDIKLQLAVKEQNKSNNVLLEEHVSCQYRFSLRVYASILYLKMPQNFLIILRGKVVEHHSIASDLKFTEYIAYKPQIGGVAIKDGPVITTIGFIKEAPMINVHGFNVYHKNRLIMPFWKIVTENSSRGRGVVGVLEANFIEPAHDKQGFERTGVFLRLEGRLKAMTIEYWNLHSHLVGYKDMTNKHPKIQRTPNYSNSAVVPHLVGVGTSNVAPIAQIPHPSSPLSSSSRNPDGVNGEGSNPLSASTSGPATPDGVLTTVKAEVDARGKKHKKTVQAPGGMTLSPESGALLTEVLEQNTSLRQKCADYEQREKHWELKLALHEKRERDREIKLTSLEKEVMEYKIKCMDMEKMQRIAPVAAVEDQDIEYHLLQLQSCKAEIE